MTKKKKKKQEPVKVLPLTREWIEIAQSMFLTQLLAVLPLTREWIEIKTFPGIAAAMAFSLLRGSGLK